MARSTDLGPSAGNEAARIDPGGFFCVMLGTGKGVDSRRLHAGAGISSRPPGSYRKRTMPFTPSLRRSRAPRFIRWLPLCACCVAGGVAGAVSPSDLQGTWEVVQVAVDQRDQPHWA